MDRKTRQSLKSLMRTACAAALCAIVVISGRVASAETDAKAAEIEIPLELANKLRPAVVVDGAFDTPFFDAKEEEITLKSLKGEGIVLNFWATWCAPCVREMPALDNLAAQLAGTGVRLITVSEDRKPLQKVPPFFEANGIKNLDLFYDEKGQLSRKLGVEGLPTTVLIDAEGNITGRVLGVIHWDAPETAQYLIESLRPQTP